MGKSIKQVLTSVAASSLAVATNPNDAQAQVPAISAAHIALSNKPVTSTRAIPGGVVNTTPQTLNPTQTQAVYINERQVFDHTTHGINLKTITTSLLASKGQPTTDANINAFWQSFINGFNDKEVKNKGGITVPLSSKVFGNTIKPSDLLNTDRFKLVAIVPRLDSIIAKRTDGSPADLKTDKPEDVLLEGAELRYVFALQNPIGQVNKALTIMEFNVPPTKKGLDGYSAFAKFWWDMQSLTPADQAERLKALTVKGWNGMPAIAKLDNLGLSGKGQVRTNNLEDVWKMHQFQASPLSNGSFGLKLTSVSATPRTELLNGSLQLTEAEIKSAVQAMGVSLFAPDLAAAKTGKVLTSANANLTVMHNGAVRPQDEAGEQILDGNSTDNLPNIVSSQFLNAVTSALPTSSNTTPGQEFPVNERIFLGRVAAASCGGCHQSQNDPAIGSPRLIADPSELTFLGKSNFFVHIDETGRPSPALTNMHLPTRFAFLERYMDALQGNRNCRDLRKRTGDFNGDGVTNALDLSIMQSVFGTKDPIADMDSNGVVNSIDLSLLKSNFGIINSSSPCPAGESQKLDPPSL